MNSIDSSGIDSIDTEKFDVLILRAEIASLIITEDGTTRILLRGGTQIDVEGSFLTIAKALAANDRADWFFFKLVRDGGL